MLLMMVFLFFHHLLCLHISSLISCEQMVVQPSCNFHILQSSFQAFDLFFLPPDFQKISSCQTQNFCKIWNAVMYTIYGIYNQVMLEL